MVLLQNQNMRHQIGRALLCRRSLLFLPRFTGMPLVDYGSSSSEDEKEDGETLLENKPGLAGSSQAKRTLPRSAESPTLPKR